MRERFRRHLTGYGEGETSREEVERSWAMLMHATRVMTAASGLLTSLPFDTVEELENAQFEERERVLDAIADLRELAYEFAAWHLESRDERPSVGGAGVDDSRRVAGKGRCGPASCAHLALRPGAGEPSPAKSTAGSIS